MSKVYCEEYDEFIPERWCIECGICTPKKDVSIEDSFDSPSVVIQHEIKKCPDCNSNLVITQYIVYDFWDGKNYMYNVQCCNCDFTKDYVLAFSVSQAGSCEDCPFKLCDDCSRKRKINMPNVKWDPVY